MFSPRRLGRAFTRTVLALVVIALLLIGVGAVSTNMTSPQMAFAYHSALEDQGASPTLAPGVTTTYTVRFRNTGFLPWQRGAASQVNLGVAGESTAYADAGMAVGWLSPTRIVTTSESLVLPGMIGTFTFTVRAP